KLRIAKVKQTTTNGIDSTYLAGDGPFSQGNVARSFRLGEQLDVIGPPLRIAFERIQGFSLDAEPRFHGDDRTCFARGEAFAADGGNEAVSQVFAGVFLFEDRVDVDETDGFGGKILDPERDGRNQRQFGIRPLPVFLHRPAGFDVEAARTKL
ncbi:MAG: hypothetical protein M0C28_32050, partial [Candidatus Moduliflexus flocculans]|nr:hypothetical protein [Candidatus Moduliflexus flocculans]